MKGTDLYPLKVKATLHAKVWGGRRLQSRLNIALPTDGPYGEAWALHDDCSVINGALAGESLKRLALRYGADLLGAGNDPRHGFPLLAKFIDADQWLSVQTHPDDQQAHDMEGEARGKTEAWIVLHAEAGAQLIAGMNHGVARDDLRKAILDGRLESHLRYVPVTAGDAFFIPAGTVHALGPGLLIYEIQQSSDTTYRLYDWGRVGLDGKPRALHIDKGVRVADLGSRPQALSVGSEQIAASPYFQTWRHDIRHERRALRTQRRFQVLSCIAGQVTLASGGVELALALGETALIPACLDAFALSGMGVILRSSQASA